LIDLWDFSPALFAIFTAPVTNVTRKDLARFGIHGNPDPLFARLLADEAQHLIGLGFRSPNGSAIHVMLANECRSIT
jgi:hypothetical protein